MKIIKFIVVFPFMVIVIFFRSMWLTIGILTYEDYKPLADDIGITEIINKEPEPKAPKPRCNSGAGFLAGLLFGYFFFDD